jgi:NitT/TauT family transport system ATP-binding protein
MSGVSKSFHSSSGDVTVALKDVGFESHAGEFVAVLGASGCGKTTVLRILAGLETCDEGEVRILGKPVVAPPEDTSLMFQSSVLLPWLTVLDNVMLPAKIGHRIDEDMKARANQLLATAGLHGFAEHFPRELSGGMRQRVALCRSLLLDPALLLMDEPFGALDALTRSYMGRELNRLWKETSKTVIFVTHDVAEAVRLSTRILIMSPRPGRVTQSIDLSDLDDSYDNRIQAPQAARLILELESELMQPIPAEPRSPDVRSN